MAQHLVGDLEGFDGVDNRITVTGRYQSSLPSSSSSQSWMS
jgi:hypothetical protein